MPEPLVTGTFVDARGRCYVDSAEVTPDRYVARVAVDLYDAPGSAPIDLRARAGIGA